jgi:formylglycine-generating enzyme required for sulfatase activity
MVAVPAADGGKYCIDSTEVTYDQYQAFLKDTNGDTSKQPSYCSWNTSFQIGDAGTGPGTIPCTYPDGGDHPVACVDWCDAFAFCSWAGKRLCNDMRNPEAGTLNPPLDAALADPINDEWVRACSAAGEYAFPYGNTYQPDTCADMTVEHDAMALQTLPVASLKQCQSASPAYAGVFDLVGNVSEWTAGSCNAPAGPNEMCGVLGSSIVDGPGVTLTGPTGCNPDYEFAMGFGLKYAGSQSAALGFRCCADL